MPNNPRDPDRNLKVFESKGVIREYLKKADLYPPERAIADILGDRLAGMRMLDIGIGGGRTTACFSGRVAEYTGVDYSASMVEACRNRFPPKPNVSFLHADVRDLSSFADASFDFVLFSYNGLDCISHPERLAALKGMRRLLKPGGAFCFSSHNLVGFGRLVSGENAGLLSGLRKALVRILLRALNGNLSALRKRPHAVVRDDGLAFRLKNYYVNPREQVSQLLGAGYAGIRVFGTDGREIPEADLDDTGSDNWIYYLAEPSV